ncbi:MAG: FadR family transcriptional regulator [Deltaproteobacteria bacterium]|nr:FadR family transcriptional regulator [Deltaproteobacteria bacterium]
MFKSVRTDRISITIVNQIKNAIFQKKLMPGDKLPSERQLMEQFQTSRVTIREAFRTLENSGILEIRRGVEGGAFVRDPSATVINNFLSDMLLMGNIAISNLTEARLAMEPFSAKIASERMNEACLKRMRENIGEAKDCLKKGNHNDARLLNLEFHRILAHACENPVIFFLIDSIMEIMEKNISSLFLSVDSVRRTIEHHEMIYDAIIKGDHDDARRLMLEHIQDIQSALEALDIEAAFRSRKAAQDV